MLIYIWNFKGDIWTKLVQNSRIDPGEDGAAGQKLWTALLQNEGIYIIKVKATLV